MSENGARRNDWTALVQRCPNRCGGGGRKPNQPRGLSRPAGRNRRSGLLSALRAHTKSPCKIDSLWRTLRARHRPGRAQTL
jgi:hypothetical protein